MNGSQDVLLFSGAFFPRLARLVRARVAIGCSFFIQGLIFATWCARIPDVKVSLALNDAQLGGLLLMLPGGQLLSMLPNGALVARWGSRRALVTAGFLYPFILLLLGFAPNAWGLAIGLFVAGWVANLSNTAANTQGVLLEQLYGRSILALFHGMWSLAGLVAVAVAMGVALLGLTPWMHFLLILLFAWGLLSFSGGALLPQSMAVSPTLSEKPTTQWRFTSFIIWIGLAALGCMACEGAIYDWSGVFLREVAMVEGYMQQLGYFAYLCTMVAGRFVVDTLTNRFGRFRVLMSAGWAIVGGLALIILCGGCGASIGFTGMILGFALVGCGTSAVVPLCCGLAGKAQGMAPSVAIAEVSTIGFFGFLAAPPLIGAIAHLSGLRAAFALMAGIGMLVPVATWMLRGQIARGE